MPMALWLCLWPYGYHYGAYVYDPMPMGLCLWPYAYGPMPMALCLWPYAYGPMPMAVAMSIVYDACVDKNKGYKDGAYKGHKWLI